MLTKNHPYTVCFSPSSNSCVAEEIPLDFFPADEILEGADLLNDDDVTSNDNLEDYLLFYNNSGNSNFHDCLSADEMNFHYDSMRILAFNILPNPFGTHVISQIEVGYELLAFGESTIFHSMVVTRSTKVPVIEEEYEEAIPLPN